MFREIFQISYAYDTPVYRVFLPTAGRHYPVNFLGSTGFQYGIIKERSLESCISYESEENWGKKYFTFYYYTNRDYHHCGWCDVLVAGVCHRRTYREKCGNYTDVEQTTYEF